jgi:hypothetical protein
VVSIEGREITLAVAGLGIVFHSPQWAEHIEEGSDYLESSYSTEQQIQSQVQQGTIVGFGTGSPGTFILRFRSGYPDEISLRNCDFKLRLALVCRGGTVCFRDLYELLDWRACCPAGQELALDDGNYHVTLCSNRPASGILGDNQEIHFYLHRLDQLPRLATNGIPTLCF